MGATQRMTFAVARLDPRARFFLLLLPRILARRTSATRLAGYALELHERGSRGLSDWCWKRVAAAAVHDNEGACVALIECYVRAGRYQAAEEFVSSYFERSGPVPGIALELIGRLVARDRFAAAHRVFNRFLSHSDEGFPLESPGPKWSDPPQTKTIRSMLEVRAAAKEESADNVNLHLALGKLCFSFGAFGASAELFERASRPRSLGAEARIAYLYVLWRLDRPDSRSRLLEEIALVADFVEVGADWQTLRATVLAAAGYADAAAAAAEAALCQTLAGHPHLPAVIADCRAMLVSIATLKGGLRLDRRPPAKVAPDSTNAVRKLFICGHGWSGSGALYDALLEFDELRVMPSTPIDRYVNASTDDEMTFVQGPGGLGALWRRARREGGLSQRQLLDLFRCHVIGGGAIQHSEHKCAKNARHLLASYGAGYSAVFMRLIAGIAALPAGAPAAELRHILAEATEALTNLLTECRHTDCVVFNNAVFGRNVDMLEIFRNFRAAVVVRDPLDQYADRREQDIKHWMTPSRFVRFYLEGRRGFARGRSRLAAAKTGEVREVEFEQFVRDETYRQTMLDWLLEGISTRRVRRRFEPERSIHNIGIHQRLLSHDERAVIEKELAQWRRN